MKILLRHENEITCMEEIIHISGIVQTRPIRAINKYYVDVCRLISYISWLIIPDSDAYSASRQ